MTVSPQTQHTAVRQPLVGRPAPDFEMPSTRNIDTLDVPACLSDYKGRYLVLLFYPLDFTFVCPTELLAFGQRKGEFTAHNAEVLGVSVDSVHSHRAWLRTPLAGGGIHGLDMVLASDLGGGVSRRYGVYLEDEKISLRGLFIIDPEGVLRHAVVHDNSIGRSVDETLRVLQAIQTGGLCPANWQPGEATLSA